MQFVNGNAAAVSTAAALGALSFGGDAANSITLRTYQREAVDAALQAIADGKNSAIRAATGAGKSLIIAAIADAFSGRVLVLCHRSELIQQNLRAFDRLSNTSAGIFAAAIRKDEPDEFRVMFGTIGTVCNALELFQEVGLVIVDECHLVPPSGDGKNRLVKILTDIPAVRLGLSATPYRLGEGLVFGPDTFFDSGLAFDIPASALLAQGYLSPLVGITTASEIDTTLVRTRCGEFVTRDLLDVAIDQDQVRATITEAMNACVGRRRILIFTVSVLHAELVAEALQDAGERAVAIHGELSSMDRSARIGGFLGGDIRWVANCDLLTTGFDSPEIDAIVLLRPTKSKNLHVQMLGRGMRLSPQKIDCLIIDFAGNISRHGNVDGMVHEVRKSAERIASDRAQAASRKIPEAVRMGVVFDPVTGIPSGPNVAKVSEISFRLWQSKKSGKTSVLVEYRTEDHGIVRAWLSPNGSWGSAWHAKKFAALRGIAEFQASPEWLLSELKLAVGRSPSHLLLSRRDQYWEMTHEFFPVDDSIWGGAA